MSSNQKMLLLGVVTVILFFLVPLGWILFIAAVALAIIFRDPLWDFAQMVGKAIFPEKKKKLPPSVEDIPVVEMPVITEPVVVVPPTPPTGGPKGPNGNQT